MNSEDVLWVFAIAIVALAVWCFVLLTWGTKKHPMEKDEWYELKFKRLLEMFFAGLMFFSIIMSFLALLPRYDYESVNQKFEDLKNKMTEIESIQQRIDAQQAEMEKRHSELENVIAKRLSRYNDAVNNELRKVNLQFNEIQKQIMSLRDEIKKGKSATEAQEVDRLIPDIAVPKIEIPKVDVPKVDVPKVDVPKVDVPKVDVPRI